LLTLDDDHMIDVAEVLDLHRAMVVRWHAQDVDNPQEGFLELVCTQFSFNFLLWHEEDIARSPDVGDKKIAEVKRKIDGYNQNRNDWIEKLDDWFTEQLEANGIVAEEGAAMNTETPGSVIDRLSIMALRIYHMQEQIERDDATEQHREAVQHKLAVCMLQLDELASALQHLLANIEAGNVRHRTYRQFKMYNDPTMNPYLYKAAQRQAG
jgi:hypothetical protein